MSEDEALNRLALASKIQVQWTDAFGQAHTVSNDSLKALLRALGLDCDSPAQIADSLARIDAERDHAALPLLVTAVAGEPIALPKGCATAKAVYLIRLESGAPVSGQATLNAEGAVILPAVAEPGYHQLSLGNAEATLAVAPARAFTIDDLCPGRRLWGLGVQTYSVRRSGDGGIGDFSGLARLARRAAAAGASALGMSPAHALFSAYPQHFGPYAPSSRVCLNTLHADPAAIFDAATIAAAIKKAGVADTMASCEALDLVDWPTAATAKYALMRSLHKGFKAGKGNAAQRADYQRFCAESGETLEDHARFEALQAAQLALSADKGQWTTWPMALRDPRSPEVARFAEEQAEAVDFHRFAQWLADRSLGAAQKAAREAGMAVGLIADLAVGTDGSGSQSWSRQAAMLAGLSVGAPPDALNAQGQDWGLSAFSPRGLIRTGFAPFLEMLRASLRNAGGVRIDHVLGFARLWLVPAGAGALEGAYLHYPIQDFLRLIALESWRYRAIVIGEDLGTVPEGFREKLGAAGLYGMRVLWFERDWGYFIEPSRWPASAVAMTSTHDVATVAGWWSGGDIEWRHKVGQIGDAAAVALELTGRAKDREQLWGAFRHAGATEAEMPMSKDTGIATDAALRYVGGTPSRLALIPIEDALGLVEQPNIPGTTDEHPNWRRRLPGDIDALLDAPEVAARLADLTEQRKA